MISIGNFYMCKNQWGVNYAHRYGLQVFFRKIHSEVLFGHKKKVKNKKIIN